MEGKNGQSEGKYEGRRTKPTNKQRMKKGCKDDDVSHIKTNALGLTFSKQQNFFFCST